MATANKPMTKSQIVTHFAEKFEMPKNYAAAILEELPALAAREIKKIGVFTIPGLGKITKRKRAARMGRNPATGEAIKIPAKTVVKARLAKAFADSVLGNKK